MVPDPQIAALRGDGSAQRAAQARLREALTAWRGGHDLDEIEAELADYAAGAVLGRLPGLTRLFSGNADAAQQLVAGFVAGVAAALAAEPLGQLSLRHNLDDRLASLLLARGGSATLTVQTIGGAALSTARTVAFSPCETHDRVIAGSARARLVRAAAAGAGSVALTSEPIALAPGDAQHRNSAGEAVLYERIAGCLVILRLQRRLRTNVPAREYDLASGALVHQAAGNPRDSRLELVAALLGRMGRSDAAPLLAAIAEEAGADGLRWQTLRECLGLDTAAGFRTLCLVASDAIDPLAVPAGALRAQLLEAHPQLAVIDPCPAS